MEDGLVVVVDFSAIQLCLNFTNFVQALLFMLSQNRTRRLDCTHSKNYDEGRELQRHGHCNALGKGAHHFEDEIHVPPRESQYAALFRRQILGVILRHVSRKTMSRRRASLADVQHLHHIPRRPCGERYFMKAGIKPVHFDTMITMSKTVLYNHVWSISPDIFKLERAQVSYRSCTQKMLDSTVPLLRGRQVVQVCSLT